MRNDRIPAASRIAFLTSGFAHELLGEKRGKVIRVDAAQSDADLLEQMNKAAEKRKRKNDKRLVKG